MQTPVTAGGRVRQPPRRSSRAGRASRARRCWPRATRLFAFFSGTQTLVTGDPHEGVDYAISADGGASWQLAPTAAAAGDFAGQRDASVALGPDGALASWYAGEETVMHFGTDPRTAQPARLRQRDRPGARRQRRLGAGRMVHRRAGTQRRLRAAGEPGHRGAGGPGPRVVPGSTSRDRAAPPRRSVRPAPGCRSSRGRTRASSSRRSTAGAGRSTAGAVGAPRPQTPGRRLVLQAVRRRRGLAGQEGERLGRLGRRERHACVVRRSNGSRSRLRRHGAAPPARATGRSTASTSTPRRSGRPRGPRAARQRDRRPRARPVLSRAHARRRQRPPAVLPGARRRRPRRRREGHRGRASRRTGADGRVEIPVAPPGPPHRPRDGAEVRRRDAPG